MYAAITDGSTTFTWIGLGGVVTTAGWIGVPITRQGVSGIAYKWTGYQARPFVLRPFVDLVLPGDIAIRKLTFSHAHLSLLTVQDDMANVWYNLMLLEAIPISERRMLRAVGGRNGGTYRFEMQLTFQPVATYY